jgi:hypothetical protein
MADGPPVVFPIPRETELLDEPFRMDDGVILALPVRPSGSDLFLAGLLTTELADRYGLALRSERVSSLVPGRRVIAMGSSSNPLVRDAAARLGPLADARALGPEGYVLIVEKDMVLIAGGGEAGAFYGLQSLRLLIGAEGATISVRGARMKDWPHEPFRGIRAYLPGPENISFFKRFIRDFMALYKFNKLILEMNAAMRLERHPELNAGAIELARSLNYSRRDRPAGPGDQYQDSAHHDTADGAILERDQVADLVAYAARHHVEVIPEIPSLSHSYYLLARHRELAEIQEAEWPDSYCPADPRSYELLFDVMDEYLDALKPKMVHIGHDEWRMPVGQHDRCRGQDVREMFARDVGKIHRFLAGRGVAAAMWGDHLLESVHGRGLERVVSPTGYAYERPGSLTPEQVRRGIPKDILIFNWFWEEGRDRAGEANDLQLQEWGFRQVYGNLTPLIRSQDYERRSARSGVIGGAASSWAASTELNFGKDRIHEFLGVGNLLWSQHWPNDDELSEIVQALMPAVRRNLSGRSPPSEDGGAIETLRFSAGLSAASVGLPGAFKTGRVSSGRRIFDLPEAGPVGGGSVRIAPAAVAVGDDVSSVLLLHACAKPAANAKAHRAPYNPADTAELLGWYEVVYDDGLLETLPIRYGVNVLEWDWRQRRKPGSYCYGADPVDVGRPGEEPITFFALEWVNPRFGKVVKEVRLRGEMILWAGLSFVKKRARP